MKTKAEKSVCKGAFVGKMRLIRSPILNICFPASEPWCVNCKSDGLKASPLSPPDELCHHIPVLVDLPRGKGERSI